MTNLVEVQYAQTGKASNTDELGMREMQAMVYAQRDRQHLLVKAPPASGKSRAMMFVALDKLANQGVKKVIVAVPQQNIGRSFKDTALKKYGFTMGEGLYTDMNAIRRDEETDNIHSIFVDQWDWEKIISREDRNIEFLKDTVQSVYKVLRKTEKYMAIRYDYIEEILPYHISFITTQELEDMYPDCAPKERELLIAREKRAVCIMQIGDKLKSGEPHDGRAPDYDDWALNADIVVYYPVLDIALELSSMGIRVDQKALLEQLDKAGCPERAGLPFQKAVLEEELPFTVGGGIGQSRICMFFLRKAHIGEVQASLWTEETVKTAQDQGIQLL